MIKANLQLIYVSDIKQSTNFYKSLFKTDPAFVSPRYVTFSAGGEALFAIWSGGSKPDMSAKRFQRLGSCCQPIRMWSLIYRMEEFG